MRRVLVVMFPVLAMALVGCPSKPKDGECKSSQDCEAQDGYGKICVEGRCQECGQDTDCKAGFVCRSNKCTPRPECSKDTDCGGGKTCQAGKCQVLAKAECEADGDCGEGKTCMGGKCVVKEAAVPSTDCATLNDVLFGFDEFTLSSDARATLEHHAGCFKSTKPSRVVIAGNADERGTAEYNLHLSQKRADAAKKYLENLGVAGKELKTVSYGKERPLCSEHDEGCWQKNRRDTFATE